MAQLQNNLALDQLNLAENPSDQLLVVQNDDAESEVAVDLQDKGSQEIIQQLHQQNFLQNNEEVIANNDIFSQIEQQQDSQDKVPSTLNFDDQLQEMVQQEMVQFSTFMQQTIGKKSQGKNAKGKKAKAKKLGSIIKEVNVEDLASGTYRSSTQLNMMSSHRISSSNASQQNQQKVNQNMLSANKK